MKARHLLGRSRCFRQRGVFGCVVELLLVDSAWRVLLLPGDCSSYCFIAFDWLAVTQFRPNPLRASDYALRRVPGQQEMLWHVLPWQHYEPSSPFRLACYFPLPFKL